MLQNHMFPLLQTELSSFRWFVDEDGSFDVDVFDLLFEVIRIDDEVFEVFTA